MLSVGAICFEDRFCASEKGGMGGGGWAYAAGRTWLALAGLFPSNTKPPWKPLLCPFRGSIFGTVGNFYSQKECLLVREL